MSIRRWLESLKEAVDWVDNGPPPGTWTTYTTTTSSTIPYPEQPRGVVVCLKGHTIREWMYQYKECPAQVYYSQNRRTKKGRGQASRGLCGKPIRELVDFERVAYELGGMEALRAILPKPRTKWVVPPP